MRIRMDAAVLALCAALAACDDDDEDEQGGAAPPPIASSRPGVCAQGGGTVADDVSAEFFPRKAGDYCIDPHGETRTYGAEAQQDLDEACTQLFDGECEVYKGYGLERVVTLRYVDGRGSPGTVNVNLSRFGSKAGAFGFFTQRIVADADPAEAAPKRLDAGGAGAIGTGIAYVWRGDHVAELSYANELEPPDQLRASSRKILPAIATQSGKRLPGDRQPPAAARALPEQHRVELGVGYSPEDVLDITGLGEGALGYYEDGPKRWRVLALARSDEASARDVMGTLKKLDGAEELEPPPLSALAFTRQADEGAPSVDWIVTRAGTRVLGIGDEPYVLRADEPAEAISKKTLDREAKLKKLEQLVREAGQAQQEAQQGAAPQPSGKEQQADPGATAEDASRKGAGSDRAKESGGKKESGAKKSGAK